MKWHRQLKTSAWCLALSLIALGAGRCATPSSGHDLYFGSVTPPAGQAMRYVSGSEPESLDPQIGIGQPESRIYVALFEGLTDYDPKTGEVVPGLAERWDALEGNTVFVFHLRRANWSDGRPITAADFVYTLRRGLSPALAASNAYMAFEILYAEGYNASSSFARNSRTGKFVMWPGKATDVRLVVPADPPAREALLNEFPALRSELAGSEAVPVRAEDVGIEALDDYTVRIRTMQPLPYLPGLMAHQFFRAVPRQSVERYGNTWTKPGHLVSSGAFLLDVWKPYDRIVVVRNPAYWDAATVKLDRLTFYAIEDQTTQLNLYKAGDIDALSNHTVPGPWHDQIKDLRDYMNQPELAIEYYMFNVTRPPMDDVRVRKAFNAAVDKKALTVLKRSAKVLTNFVPRGLFDGYPYPDGDGFDVARAKALLAEAGYRDASGQFDPSRFPSDAVEVLYNTLESNRVVAEFMQAQWRQNLGITVPLRNMEFRTFVKVRNAREYRGIARAGWVGDYFDPVTFLDLFSTFGGNNGSGWYRPEYVQMLKDANREPDQTKRYALLARAERYMLEAQPVIPLYIQGTNWLKKPYVKGMYANPITNHPWKYVYIEHDRSQWD
jgi:ABC-type oligopeptide transport system substrate-binding subunit